MNPFATSDGMEYVDATSRLERVKEFSAEECLAALELTGLQKTVRAAVERRLRKLRAPVARSYRKKGEPRYEVWPIEKERSAYRFQVVDLELSAKIVARCSTEENAENIAKQLNEKGFVESLA